MHEAPYDFFRYTPYGINYLFDEVGFVNVVVESPTGLFHDDHLEVELLHPSFYSRPKISLRWLVYGRVTAILVSGPKRYPIS